jgi:hypothetical protein
MLIDFSNPVALFRRCLKGSTLQVSLIEVNVGRSVWLFPDSQTVDVIYDVFDHSLLEDLFLGLYAGAT